MARPIRTYAASTLTKTNSSTGPSSVAKRTSSAGRGFGTVKAIALLEGIPETETVLLIESRRIHTTSIRSALKGLRLKRDRFAPLYTRVGLFCRRAELDTWPRPGTARWSSFDWPFLYVKTLRRLSDGLLLVRTISNKFFLIGA